MQPTIGQHGVVGDLRTGALIAIDGAIDFFCWPRFDSPTVFARLLDWNKGGAFTVEVELDSPKYQQMYLPDTNVLLTRILSSAGVVEISDFMSIDDPDQGQRLVRRIKVMRESVDLTVCCAPRFDYARATHDAEAFGDHCVVFNPEGSSQGLCLHASTALSCDGSDAMSRFTLEPGETAWFILESPEQASSGLALQADYVKESFKRTSDFWRHWVESSSYSGRWQAEVNRSALALKLLTSAEHGSMIAALTFGLPETLGGSRNWDYRFTWIRDSAFTAYAFIRLGFTQEANAFVRWLGERTTHCDSDGELQLMYGLDGHSNLQEKTLDHLAGYADSRPVRIGNGAAGQLQLDIYGELMDAVYLTDKYGEQLSSDHWRAMQLSLEFVCNNWEQADESIWEVRGGRKHFLHTRVMCWVALDRGLRYSAKRGAPAPVDKWRRERDRIYADVYENFWNEDLGAFVQSAGSDVLDAACLLMPLVRFISPTDPRWLSTMDAIRDNLLDDSMVYRYSHGTDGLDGKEGTFNMCSFWYVECLARAGDLAQARLMFEKMLSYANHLGLFAEETGSSGEQLGNFPQAFTHLALISAAFYLNRHLSTS